ncbi:MAG: hypothetical protein GX090_07200 [Firmicutes bacterium]|nr:hypothetical protein [Bacillota bacterium]
MKGMLVLALLYALLLLLEGARFCLLEQIAAQDPASRRLQRYVAGNVAWRRQLARAVKDWLVAGIMGGVAVWGLMHIAPRVYPLILAGLALFAALRTSSLLVLLAFRAGVVVPHRLLAIAVQLALPGRDPCGRKRVVAWGALFALSGGIGLAAWARDSALLWLCWGFVTLTMGFVSFIRGIKEG